MFKRGQEPKHALGLGVADYHQEFWMVNNQSFYQNYDYKNLVSYDWVIPVYVYSLNEVWNGETTFDVTPINYGIPSNKRKPWPWSLTIRRDQIGVKVFHTKEKGWEAYHKTLPGHFEGDKKLRWGDLRQQVIDKWRRKRRKKRSGFSEV